VTIADCLLRYTPDYAATAGHLSFDRRFPPAPSLRSGPDSVALRAAEVSALVCASGGRGAAGSGDDGEQAGREGRGVCELADR